MEHITLEIQSATIGYKSRGKNIIIASDISGSFSRGELVSLIGCNGSGKSTLLRSIAGFQPILKGKILQEGKDIKDYSIQERSRLLSIVTTSSSMAQEMTTYDLVAMGRCPYTGFWGTLTARDKAIVHKSIQMVGMESYLNRMVSTLSDGEREKVLIAKAIAQETPFIILDEPTSFLDYPSKIITMQLLKKLAHEHNKTVLISTHDLEQALQFSDRIWLIDQEKRFLIGTPDEMVNDGMLQKTFGYRG